jgi:hypothetical protein
MRVRFSACNKAYTAISTTGGPWAGDMLRRTLVQIATNATNHIVAALIISLRKLSIALTLPCWERELRAALISDELQRCACCMQREILATSFRTCTDSRAK